MPTIEERVLALEYAVAAAIYGGHPKDAKEQWDKDHAPKPEPMSPGPPTASQQEPPPQHHQSQGKSKKER
jgi:hypothetical protein